jgi:hypothetical protein
MIMLYCKLLQSNLFPVSAVQSWWLFDGTLYSARHYHGWQAGIYYCHGNGYSVSIRIILMHIYEGEFKSLEKSELETDGNYSLNFKCTLV